MIEWSKLLLGFGPILAGTFAIVYHKSIHESLIKFFKIEDYRLKALGSFRLVLVGIVLIVLGLVRIITS